VSGVLAGKVVVCTGGGSGIGRAPWDAFVAAGARVVVLELDETKCEALSTAGDSVLAVAGDASTAAGNEHVVAQALSRWTRRRRRRHLRRRFSISTHRWRHRRRPLRRHVRRGLRPQRTQPLLTARAALPALRSTRGSDRVHALQLQLLRGRAVPCTSARSSRSAVPSSSSPRELAPDVRVNGVAPGGTVGHGPARAAQPRGSTTIASTIAPVGSSSFQERTPSTWPLTAPTTPPATCSSCRTRARGMTGEILRSDRRLGVR